MTDVVYIGNINRKTISTNAFYQLTSYELCEEVLVLIGRVLADL